MRHFFFDPIVETQYKRYCDYAGEINERIDSLRNYIEQTNPNYYVLNQHYIVGGTPYQLITDEELWSGEYLTREGESIIIHPKRLKFHEGILNNFGEDIDICIATTGDGSSQIVKKLPQGFIIFANKISPSENLSDYKILPVSATCGLWYLSNISTKQEWYYTEQLNTTSIQANLFTSAIRLCYAHEQAIYIPEQSSLTSISATFRAYNQGEYPVRSLIGTHWIDEKQQIFSSLYASSEMTEEELIIDDIPSSLTTIVDNRKTLNYTITVNDVESLPQDLGAVVRIM